jgi:tetratricopeptide (TPR) repeat protein
LQLDWTQRATTICPADPWAHGQAADALLQFFRLDEASAELDLCELYGDSAFAITGRARILRLQGRLNQALEAYRRAQKELKGREDAVYAWSGSAETLREMWRLEEALGEYERAIASHPGELILQCGRASVLTELGRLDDALSAYDHILVSQDDLIALNGKASVLKQMGKFEDSLSLYERIRELYPTDPVSVCGHADVLRQQEEFKTALKLYAQAKEDYPFLPVAYSGYAEVLRDMGRLQESITAYREACARFPFEARLANGYANARKVNNEYAAALRQYEENTRQFPYSLISKVGRADLLKRLGHHREALDAYDQIISVWPDFPTARFAKAAVLVLIGDLESAGALLPQTPPKTREDWIAFHIRGMILLRKKKFDEAIVHFSEGSAKIPFKRERRVFDGALCVARIQKGLFQAAATAVERVPGEIPRVLHFHAVTAAGQRARSKEVYKRLSIDCPPQLIELAREIAARFKLIDQPPAHNDNWIFDTETELLLQEAA